MTMMEGRIATLLREHGELEDSGGVCECGYWSSDRDWASHVADLIADLCLVKHVDEEIMVSARQIGERVGQAFDEQLRKR